MLAVVPLCALLIVFLSALRGLVSDVEQQEVVFWGTFFHDKK